MLTPTLEHWQAAAANPELLAQAAATEPGDVNGTARLRRTHAPEAVAAALDLTRARVKAHTKFPHHAATLLADPAGVEQASSLAVAAYKARRFLDRGAASVTDLCCGVGGDSLALSTAGLSVTAVDHDPVRAWMAGHNAGVSAQVADASDPRDPCVALHIDPARRTAAGRAFRLADTLPPPAAVTALAARHAGPGLAVKLSPAVDRTELGDLLPPGELEFISEAGRLVQAVLWTGGLAEDPTTRRATRLEPDGTLHTVAGPRDEPAWSAPRRLLFTADPALERAGLLHHPGLPAIHPRLGLLTADEDPQSPWLTAFELVEQMPWREKRVRAALAALEAGLVEVKTRDKAVNPDQAQLALRGTGPNPFTVFILRWDRQVVALITRRLKNPA